MRHIVDKKWKTGSHECVDFYNLLNLSREYIRHGSKIFIGSDSFINKDRSRFKEDVD